MDTAIDFFKHALRRRPITSVSVSGVKPLATARRTMASLFDLLR
jgi:hypothetical protein